MKDILKGLLVLFSALPIAYIIYLINEAFPNQPEKAAMIVGCLLLALLLLPPGIYLLFRRMSANPWRLGLIVIASIGVLLVSVFLYWASSYILFPADILLWSESDFINDILKIRLGYPLYTSQLNNESFYYTPGAQILSYLLARLLGGETVIPLYRVIQLGYLLLAAIVSALCCHRLVEISSRSQQFSFHRLWGVVWFPILFLICTNSITNKFVYYLHHDALALLVSIMAYWLLLEYVSTRDRRVLVLMAIIPAAGFFVKQSLGIWAPLYCLYFALFERPRSLSRLATFAVLSFGLTGAVVCVCYLLWGNDFIYWMLALSKDGISPLRSFQHILDCWIYFVLGLLGGITLLRGKNFDLLLGPWVIWLLLIFIEGYTSGIGWMRNHLGPGSLISGVWFLASLARMWPSITRPIVSKARYLNWLRAGITVAVLGLIFSGMGFIRIPVKSISDDAYRYLREIEREFEGQDVDTILLDAGTWIYLKEGVVMKDRALPIANRGYSGTGNLSATIARFKEKRYSKILVRNLNSPGFLYDHWMSPKSTGIKRTLLENYSQAGKIESVQGSTHNKNPYYFFDEISILVPNKK